MTLQKRHGAVRRFEQLMRLAAWLQNVLGKWMPPPFRLMHISAAFWQSRTLYVAVRLDIATKLGDKSLDVDSIAALVSAQPDAVYRMLRLLAALGIFEEVSPKVFRNNAISAYLQSDHPKSVKSLILMHNSIEMSRPWYEQLESGIRQGQVPFEITHGSEFVTYMNVHTEFDELFSKAMNDIEALTGDSFATDFDWESFDRVIDVGGAMGAKSVTLLKRHSHLSALVFDRPQVVQNAANYWAGKASPELLSRLDFQAGDMLQSVPEAANGNDIYLLSAIMHGMSDECCVRVLDNLAVSSANSGARVALMELVVPAHKADSSSAAFDMQMLMATNGKERTLSEWRQLFDRTAWTLTEVVSLRSLAKILVLGRRQKTSGNA